MYNLTRTQSSDLQMKGDKGSRLESEVPDSTVKYQPGENKSPRFEPASGEVNCIALLVTVI